VCPQLPVPVGEFVPVSIQVPNHRRAGVVKRVSRLLRPYLRQPRRQRHSGFSKTNPTITPVRRSAPRKVIERTAVCQRILRPSALLVVQRSSGLSNLRTTTTSKHST
jgi:hypothetical protein